jgi:hypothetical protein
LIRWETNIREPYRDILIGEKQYVTLDTAKGLQKLRESL